MDYFTSDLHFGHENIIKYENRPFINVEDMTKGLIERWNRKVSPNDRVYILGDFAFQNSVTPIEKIESIIEQLNGEKHLIFGNHDNWVFKKNFNPRLFESISPYMELKKNKNIIVLCHYPIESWNRKEYGSIHLHGHLHSYPTKLALPNRYNVGCDNWNYEPVSMEEILEGRIINELQNEKRTK